MKPLIKPTKKKTEAGYKTIYIKETLEKERKVNRIRHSRKHRENENV